MGRHRAEVGFNPLPPDIHAIAVRIDLIALCIGVQGKLVVVAAGRALRWHSAATFLRPRGADDRREDVAIGRVRFQIGRIVQDQDIILTRRQAQATADDLLQQADAFGAAQDRDQVNVRRIPANSQHVDVDKILDLLAVEPLQDQITIRAHPGHDGRLARRERCQYLFGVLDRRGKEYHALPVLRLTHNVSDD